MRILISIAFMLFANRSFAALNCEDLAIQAAWHIFQSCENNLTKGMSVKSVSVQPNPNNTSNGVSLIVSIDDSQYLVLLTALRKDGKADAGCTKVNYVIEYPYLR